MQYAKSKTSSLVHRVCTSKSLKHRQPHLPRPWLRAHRASEEVQWKGKGNCNVNWGHNQTQSNTQKITKQCKKYEILIIDDRFSALLETSGDTGNLAERGQKEVFWLLGLWTHLDTSIMYLICSCCRQCCPSQVSYGSGSEKITLGSFSCRSTKTAEIPWWNSGLGGSVQVLDGHTPICAAQILFTSLTIWRFQSHGGPPKKSLDNIHFVDGCSMKETIQLLGYPMYGTPQVLPTPPRMRAWLRGSAWYQDVWGTRALETENHRDATNENGDLTQEK